MQMNYVHTLHSRCPDDSTGGGRFTGSLINKRLGILHASLFQLPRARLSANTGVPKLIDL